MIRVEGEIKLRGNFILELDMTEEEFDSLSKRKQDQIIEDNIDWRDFVESTDTDDIEVDDFYELEEETK